MSAVESLDGRRCETRVAPTLTLRVAGVVKGGLEDFLGGKQETGRLDTLEISGVLVL